MALIQRTARRSTTRSPSVRVLYLSQSLALPPPDRTLPVAPSFILHPRLAAKFVLRFVSFGFSFFRLFLASLSSNDIPCFFFHFFFCCTSSPSSSSSSFFCIFIILLLCWARTNEHVTPFLRLSLLLLCFGAHSSKKSTNNIKKKSYRTRLSTPCDRCRGT